MRKVVGPLIVVVTIYLVTVLVLFLLSKLGPLTAVVRGVIESGGANIWFAAGGVDGRVHSHRWAWSAGDLLHPEALGKDQLHPSRPPRGARWRAFVRHQTIVDSSQGRAETQISEASRWGGVYRPGVWMDLAVEVGSRVGERRRFILTTGPWRNEGALAGRGHDEDRR